MLAARFASLFVILFIGHHLGDYWVQTDRQTANKISDSWRGRLFCAQHVATYTTTMLAILLLATRPLELRLDGWQVALAITVVAGTHYLADRRRPLRWLAVRAWHSATWLDDEGGLAFLDQSWHLIWVFVAALIMT